MREELGIVNHEVSVEIEVSWTGESDEIERVDACGADDDGGDGGEDEFAVDSGDIGVIDGDESEDCDGDRDVDRGVDVVIDVIGNRSRTISISFIFSFN